MNECYFKECPNHHKDEPLCKLSECIATEIEVNAYRALRLEYLKKYDIEPVMGGIE
jgi:hypothetical protein